MKAKLRILAVFGTQMVHFHVACHMYFLHVVCSANLEHVMVLFVECMWTYVNVLLE